MNACLSVLIFLYFYFGLLFKTNTLNSFLYLYSDQSVYDVLVLETSFTNKYPSGSSLLCPSLRPCYKHLMKVYSTWHKAWKGNQKVLFVVSSAKRQLDVWVGDTIWRAGDRMESSGQWQIWKSLQASQWLMSDFHGWQMVWRTTLWRNTTFFLVFKNLQYV